jgi:hypothetical protein
VSHHFEQHQDSWGGRLVAGHDGHRVNLVPVKTTVRFDTARPWELLIRFWTDPSDSTAYVDWYIGWELLRDFLRLQAPTGQGDLRLHVDTWHRDQPAIACLTLGSDQGQAELLIDMPELQATFHRVSQLLDRYRKRFPPHLRICVPDSLSTEESLCLNAEIDQELADWATRES